jgi:hypothetical protein
LILTHGLRRCSLSAARFARGYFEAPPLPPARAALGAPPGRMDSEARPRTGRTGVGILPVPLGPLPRVAAGCRASGPYCAAAQAGQ